MDDAFDIKSLPNNFVPVSRPSEIIHKLNKKRRDAHDGAIKVMRDQMRTVNLEVDEEIRTESEKYLNKLRDLKKETDGFVCGINDEYKAIQNVNLEEDTVNNIFKKLTGANTTQLKIVEELYDKLVYIEKNRSENFKLILKETKEKVLTISHELPFKTEEFFENELVNINQITLNNYQNYAELIKELKLQVKNHMKRWSEELLEFKEKLRNFLKLLAKKSVVRIQSTLKQDATSYMSTDLTKEIMKIKSLHSDMQWFMTGEEGFPVSLDEVEEWLKGVQQTLACLDQSAKNIVTFYKSIIIILFNRFFGELEDLKETMVKTGIVNPDDIEDFQSEIYTPAIDEINVQFHSDFDKLKTVWGNAISTMEETVDTTYKFLKSAAILWDKHFARVKDLQLVVMNDVANTVVKNNDSAEMFEIEMNVALDKLRQGPNEKKLEKYLEDTVAILDKLEKLYASHCTIETQVVQKYKTMMEVEIEVLMSEIKRFLVLNPPDTDRDPKKQRRRASQISEKSIDPNETLVPRQIMYCTFQVDAVKNWMFGLWEAIDHYLSTCKAEILVVSENWVEKQCEKINERLKVKLAFHKPRYYRIKCSIYEKRLMELTKHSKRIFNHKLAAETELKKLKEFQSFNDEQFTDICNQFTLKSEELLKNVKYLQKSHLIRGRFQVVPSMFKNHEQILNKIGEEYKEKSIECLERLKISNYKFIKASKLFAEGGNFNMEELGALLKLLTKLEQSTQKTVEKCINEEKVKHNKYHSQLQHTHAKTLSTVEKLIEEHEHNERVVKIIKNLQKNIRSEVVLLKTELKNIDSKITKIIQDADSNVEVEDYLSSFSPKYDDIISDLLILYDFLVPTKKAQVPNEKNVVITKSKSDKHKNYSELLFDTEPKNENSFISKLEVLLYTSFLNIQNEAKEFYNKHRILLLDSTKLQQTYDGCMEEVLDTYNSFKMQCDLCRNENLSVFLSILNNFKNYREHYLGEFRNAFYRLSTERFTNTSESIFLQLNEKKDEVTNTFHKIFSKLKALYGHPKNRNLLENLQNEFDTILKENEQTFQEIADPLREILEKAHGEELKKYENVDTTIKSLSEDDRLDLLVEEMKTHLGTNNDSFKLPNTDEQSKESDNVEQKSVSKNILDYLKNGSPPICTDNLKIKSQTIYSISTDETYINPEEYLNELGRTLKRNTEQITEFVKTHFMKYNDDFKDIWNSEVNFILALYNVKYDEKNIF